MASLGYPLGPWALLGTSLGSLEYPLSTQCLLFDGGCVPVKNVNGQSGHAKYTGTAPIFITTKLSDIDLLAARGYVDPVTGAPGNSDASMILRRLKVHAFRQRVQKPNQRVEYCPSCFARLVLAQCTGMS